VKDQAAQLRQMNTAKPGVETPVLDGPPTIVIASGKGGVGKSAISTLLAHALTDEQRQVLLLEGAQNLGNLHVLLGVRPTERLEALFYGDASPSDLLTPVTDSLWLLSGDSGTESLYALGAIDRARLHHRLNSLYDRFDAVVIDAGSGLDSVVRVASMRATQLILVTVPEPAALIDAYAVMKIVHLQIPTLDISVLVNCVENGESGRPAFEKLSTACSRFLKFAPGYLGEIPFDTGVRDAVRNPGGLIKLPNSNPALKTLRAMVAKNQAFWSAPAMAQEVAS
jgi:flagellar biosynthesis protein FlhG